MNASAAIVGVCDRLEEQADDLRYFDSDFFSVPADEAALLTPQHRLLAEGVWQALESACAAGSSKGKLGLFVGCDAGSVCPGSITSGASRSPHSVSGWKAEMLVSADWAVQWVSQTLNLRGPCLQFRSGELGPIAVLRAACQALNDGECDLVIAGALAQVGDVGSGRGRAVYHGWRAGLLALKRYKDAVADGDTILGVIGSAAAAAHHSLAEPTSVPSNGVAAADEFGSLQGMRAVFDAIGLRDRDATGPDQPWPRQLAVFDRGDSSAGIVLTLRQAGGTRASGLSRAKQVLCLSAQSERALQAASENLKRYLADHPDCDLADVAYTLQLGRMAFACRQALVCGTVEEAVKALGVERAPARGAAGWADRGVVFMFPGAGTHHVGMARGLYESEPFFRDALDRCCEILRSQEDFDLKSVLYPDDTNARMDDAVHVLVALFSIEYSLAQLWIKWGVEPEAMIGHSAGEYVAACVSGVFSLQDALKIIALRGKLFNELPPGAMLSVAMPASALAPFVGENVSLASINTPSHCVLSGSIDSMARVREELSRRDIDVQLLPVGRAGHSTSVEPILERFVASVRGFSLGRPRIPYKSNLTGTWIREAEARDPGYWAAHLRHTVRFSQGLEELLFNPGRIFLELGPGRSLSAFARQHRQAGDRVIPTSKRHPRDTRSDVDISLQALAKVWTAGIDIGDTVYASQSRRRVQLPTYPFQRRYHWINAPEEAQRPVEPDRNSVTPPAQDGSLDSSIAELEELVAVRGLEDLSDEELLEALGEFDATTK